MALQAEMVWAFMAPPTFATERVIVAAALEPAYEVGGDAFDYSLLGDRLNVSIFDAAGHDLTAGLIASVAMAGCRNTRRSGGDLLESVTCVDQAIAGRFDPSRFATALLCELDIAAGELTWIVCGHPPPLLIRDNQVVKELRREPHLPLGLACDDAPPQIHHEQLQPGDRVLLYTDGVVEGRGPDGDEFGLKRLSEFIIRHSTRGMSAPETLRRLNRTIVDYQNGRLTDDATTLLVEWMPADSRRQLTPQLEAGGSATDW
ncbi:PP2C family protein-serine/threonine phosphatase, partial [Actinomadura sp. HBU206391]|uniref:PP2C family protein-serine/threonine phosphatase n=1 Tax=Actinomadura sp. HBU206391 TaxID=2731692 RepID=UPI00165057DD